MKLYVRSFLLIFGALLLTSCVSYRSEVEQSASVPTSVEEQVVANETPEKLAVAELTPVSRDDEIVCKADAKTGSRLPTREVCATRKQWSDSARAPREEWKNELEQPRYSS